MQWRNWRKITSLWRFELDAKSGPLEAGDFGEIGNFGKNRQRAGDMWQKIQIGCPEIHAMAKLAKNRQPLAIFELDAKSAPLEAGDFGEIGDFGKNRHACNGETDEK